MASSNACLCVTLRPLRLCGKCARKNLFTAEAQRTQSYAKKKSRNLAAPPRIRYIAKQFRKRFEVSSEKNSSSRCTHPSGF